MMVYMLALASGMLLCIFCLGGLYYMLVQRVSILGDDYARVRDEADRMMAEKLQGDLGVRKGGVNFKYQILNRPPPPSPMKSDDLWRPGF